MKIVISLIFLFQCATLFAQDTITIKDIQSAEKILNLNFSEAKEKMMLKGVQSNSKDYEDMHRFSLENSVPLPLAFNPALPYMKFNTKQNPVNFILPKEAVLPANRNDLAFYSLPQLASLIRNKKITSVELTRFFIGRLKKYGDTLQCIVSLTEDIAIEEAAKADKEIAAGNYRGILHGIPYGLKDLFAVKGAKTTWGAAPYKEQTIDNNSYVYTKLKAAGAVLVAKLTLGALAMGDYWYGGQTKNPWDLKTGSSGS
ncbi:MAG: amidase, partial [Ginsengibacter sp.]